MLTRPLWVVLAVAIMAGAGCSSGPEHDDEHRDAAEDRSQWASPLAAFLSLDPGGMTAAERVAEQEVAACMRVAGFEYVPATEADELPGELTTLADASAHGYGLTIHPATEVDVNETAYEALPAAEQRRWDDALYGPVAGSGTQGCLTQTTGPVAPEQLLQEALGRPEFLVLADQLADLETTIVTDQRVTAAGAEWSACMGRVEFPDLDAPGDGFEFVLERAGRAVGVDVARDGFDTAWLDDLPDEELAELQEVERSVASADVRCMEAFDRLEREVRTTLEDEFVADHREALDSLRSVIQQQP